MRHVKELSVARADTSNTKDDMAGALFLQLWFTVVFWMLASAMGKD